MERACELGLYERQKLGFLDKLGFGRKEEYIPVSISPTGQDFMETVKIMYEDDKEQYEEDLEYEEMSADSVRRTRSFDEIQAAALKFSLGGEKLRGIKESEPKLKL